MKQGVGVAAALLVIVTTGALAEVAVPVSPGGQGGMATVLGMCPTFHWTTVNGAEAVDLVIYRVPEDEAEGAPERVLSVTLPGSASGWTPSLGQCLEPGGRYAWSVGVGGEWSEARLFEVAARPSTEEVSDALMTLQRFLAEEGEATAATMPDLDQLRWPRATPGASTPSHERATDQGALVFDTTGIRAEASSPERFPSVAGGHFVASVAGQDGFVYGVVGEATYGSTRVGVLGVADQIGRGVEGQGALGVLGSGTVLGGYFTGAFGSVGRALYAKSEVCCNGGLPSEHSALVTNTANGGDVLALKVSLTSPGNGTNFISFFGVDGGDQLLGEIEGDGSGGVQFTGTVVSPSSDFAEYLPRLHEREQLAPGEVVGLYDGRVSRRTRNAERVMVVSTRPIVVGGLPEPEEASRYAKVALLGQVPVKVKGAVAAGDLLVPSGDEDGTAVAARGVTGRQARLVVGRALEDSAGSGKTTVKVLVGLPEVASAGGWGAATRKTALYQWLAGIILLSGVVLAVGRWRFGYP